MHKTFWWTHVMESLHTKTHCERFIRKSCITWKNLSLCVSFVFDFHRVVLTLFRRKLLCSLMVWKVYCRWKKYPHNLCTGKITFSRLGFWKDNGDLLYDIVRWFLAATALEVLHKRFEEDQPEFSLFTMRERFNPCVFIFMKGVSFFVFYRSIQYI